MSVEKSSKILISNIVEKEKMREFQSKTLKILKDTLINSFGPFGSTTIINKKGALTQYTKDGHTILKNIMFSDCIENTVKSDIEDITRHIVKKVGDGTTSAIILSSIIFEKLKELENDLTPFEIIEQFKKTVDEIKNEILKNKKEFNANKAYKIAYTSTNGNKKVSQEIKQIYREYGNDVFINVTTSINNNTYVKSYDGMTLETGYGDSAFINDIKKGCCTLNRPRIYTFQDPIDTKELMGLFATIIDNNIMKRYQNKKAPIPTVIMTPKISRDMENYMEQLVNFIYQFKDSPNKPPILILSNINNHEIYLDIARMCNCKMIKKYINLEQQKIDIKNGIAPDIKNICEFYGSADIVESDITRTKFVNPVNMMDKNGNYTKDFNILISFLEAELKKAYENGENNNNTGNLKRRINSLKANMIDYYIGGISMSDRDALKDLVEDAVLNCRSSSINGVGYGANFEGLYAAYKNKNKSKINKILYEAYVELSKILYDISYCNNSEEIVNKSISLNKPYNIRTGKFDGDVLCSIYGDIIILDSISKIISLMFASNQFLCPSPIHNKYLIL